MRRFLSYAAAVPLGLIYYGIVKTKTEKPITRIDAIRSVAEDLYYERFFNQ